MSFRLVTGAEARWTGTPGAHAVVCVNGGTAAEVPGTWSASVEWLVRRLSPRHPSLAFLEVRYRVKSWRQLQLCVEDARAAVAAARGIGTVPPQGARRAIGWIAPPITVRSASTPRARARS